MAEKKKSGTQAPPTWTLRGIDPETRTAVTKAARRAGEGVGEWCNRALRDAATEQLKDAPPPAIRPEDLMVQLLQRLDRIEEAQRLPFWKRLFRTSNGSASAEGR
jgi:hypothetical protein